MSDLVVVATALAASQLWRFGATNATVLVGVRLNLNVAYTIVTIVFAVAWMVALGTFASRDRRYIGVGNVEYGRLTQATLAVYGLLAIAAYLTQVEIARGYFLISLPLGLSLLLISRWAWRQVVIRLRGQGKMIYRALLMGSPSKTEHVAASIGRDTQRSHGYSVVGAVIPEGVRGDKVGDVDVLGDFDDLDEALEISGADAIVLTGSDRLSHRNVRALSWELEDRGVRLIVAPALTDIAGPRIHARPVAGLPLIQVDFPTFEGRKHVFKRAFDIAASAFALVLLSPVLVGVAIAVRADSPGSIFFAQERIGINGATFRMLKFRSMIVDAEARLQALQTQSDGNAVMFKMRDDPRVTRVGRVLRKFSLDELPQFVNVLLGSMSLVGPRPPLATEVAQYNGEAQRRLLVKPGITGLWQVSGRSNLSWDDSVRLDLYYVENWSLMGDIVILYRTVKAVLSSDGSY